MKPCPKPVTIKDKAYLAYLRTRPCHFLRFGDCNPFDTMGNGRSEVSHLAGKSSDHRAISCCGGHHRTNKFSWHNGARSFCKHYGLWKEDLIREAEANYRRYLEGL